MVFRNKILYICFSANYDFCFIEKFSKTENFSIGRIFLIYKKAVDFRRFFLPLFGIH